MYIFRVLNCIVVNRKEFMTRDTHVLLGLHSQLVMVAIRPHLLWSHILRAKQQTISKLGGDLSIDSIVFLGNKNSWANCWTSIPDTNSLLTLMIKSFHDMESTISGSRLWTTPHYQSLASSCWRHSTILTLASTEQKLEQMALSIHIIQSIMMIGSILLKKWGAPQASKSLNVTSLALSRPTFKSTWRILRCSSITKINSSWQIWSNQENPL